MILSAKEVSEIRSRLANIEKAERIGIKKNYLANQVRHIRLLLAKADRREKNTIFNQ